MASAWKWYIVILCSEDYYTLYDSAAIVKARTTKEAGKKALANEGDRAGWLFVTDVFGPFAEKPGEA